MDAAEKRVGALKFREIFSESIQVHLEEFDQSQASIAGIYVVSFQAKHYEFGSGIAVITEDGRLGGGDSRYYYSATLHEEEGSISGEVKVVNYQGDRNSVLGALDTFTLSLSGRAQGFAFTLAGQLVENPNIAINLAFKKLRDFLPAAEVKEQ